MHNHGGTLSVVIFLKIPEEINEERRKSTFSAKASGCLQFMFFDQHILVKPKEAMMYIFPAYLWHSVYPFITDTERISMSFNFHDILIDGRPVPINDTIFIGGNSQY